ncbi:MAG: GNAT family N-acetyltransferase [Clostridia bacterium]|nr:GNAT family N-acetyltransferase [Clostridia bacterium]
MSDYLHRENTPVLDTLRLLLRPLVPSVAPDLAEWLSLDEVCTCRERKSSADIRNTGSNRVLEKCGFRRKDTARQGKMVSVHCNCHLYELPKSGLAQ